MKKIYVLAITLVLLLCSQMLFIKNSYPKEATQLEAQKIAEEVAQEKAWERQKIRILAQGYYKEGVISFNAKQYDKALKMFIESYNLDPTNEYARAYMERIEVALAEQEKEHLRMESIESKNKVTRLIKEGMDDIRQNKPEMATKRLQEAKFIEPDSRRVESFLKIAREAEIQKTLNRFQNEKEVKNEERLIDINKGWVEPTIPTQRDEIYYSKERLEKRKIFEEKAKQPIPTIEFNDAQLKDVLKYLSGASGINIVIDEKAVLPTEAVTIYLKDTSLADALRIILRAKGMTYRIEEDLIWVTTKDRLAKEDMIVEVYDVQDLLGRVYDFPSIPMDETYAVTKPTEKKKEEKK